jgi:hypothetical protein
MIIVYNICSCKQQELTPLGFVMSLFAQEYITIPVDEIEFYY